VELSGLGRVLIVVGVVVVLIGGLLVVGGWLGLGKLPGDFSFSWGGVKVYAPLATGIILSVVLSILLSVFLRR
jgi:hypothetical protein